jgi:1-deoxy-D-xylulose-5-phosphate reductoisomerase
MDTTIRAIHLGLKIALANKETLVTAGPAIRKLLLESRSVLIPVDSEHNALFQSLLGVDKDHVESLILTASGGPFRDLPEDQWKYVKHEEVLSHPTWNMGPKITVDSAGMVNKALEVIEAHYLYGVSYKQLSAYIHRSSIVHAMVKMKDGSFRFTASHPHMIFPVAHAVKYPDSPVHHNEATDPSTWPGLTFETISPKFKGYYLGLQAGQSGGTAPAIFNAVNEVAVELFLSGIIEFTDISHLIELTLDASDILQGDEVELFRQADAAARRLARQKVSQVKRL